MKSVLMIDDDAILLRTVGVRLKSLGYTVHTAMDAVTAISMARKSQPDVVVLDISMPGGSGFTVAQRLKNMQSLSACAIIFITASEDGALDQEVARFGVEGFLRKPFSAEELSHAIESATGAERGA